ncbi:single-stranded DNA-binding protein [Niabella ginsengisoli]|uniref:Single-stranded DNA-binding protein n=1 Tax=Niabella ginsengisoli TaxID=522298 RepID=A0ABS9SRM6_9BACT|nr:single-stranded DNA-binding protein [Niabella ginsengisoli]MCH5600906.1 single-stranded DNA-binding protein [Niabella ginsengisoli]
MIKIQVIGRLGKDCLVNNVNGRNVINFTVAHSERYKDSQGVQQERTTWVDCAYWTDRTAVAPYLLKGTQVFVEGQPEVRSFTKSDGTAGAALSMRVREVQLLGSKNDGGSQPGNNNYNAPQANTSSPSSSTTSNGGSEEPIDDLPF